MLIHHLFYSESSRELYDDIEFSGYGIVNEIGKFCKLCVSIFVFKSGFGLTINWDRNRPNKLKDFYVHRFSKLYLNYWFIWLLFVPVGVFLFDRTFTDVYGDYYVIKFIMDFAGVLNCFGMLGYNPTWWFYSCIILLYALFPLLQKMSSGYSLLILTFGLLSSQFLHFIPFTPIANVVLPFLAGIYIARQPLGKLQSFSKTEILISMLFLCAAHNFCGDLKPMVNTLLCVDLALFVSKAQRNRYFRTTFAYLGKHSTNVFLFHTFIFYFWFRDFIYISRNPVIILLELLIVCYTISTLIELAKTKIGFYKLCK